jgi:hypothetical protein
MRKKVSANLRISSGPHRMSGRGHLSKNVWALLRKKVSANLRISSSPHRMMAALVLDEYLRGVAWRAV